MGSWLPFVDDQDTVDPRWSETFQYLYDNVTWDDFGRQMFDSDEWKKAMFFISGLPVVGDIAVMADSYRSFQDYMKNSGLTWSDILYPALTGRKYGVSSSAYGALNFVSSNLNRLYR